MIQVYADGELAYDNRLDEYDLQGLKITTGLRIGGTAEIVMPPRHPAYSLFTGYRAVVEILRDGVLRFRGRALYPVDDFTNQRTVVCEGEFCFLQDAVSRPYTYQADPATVFAAVIAEYNAQVEEFKRFRVGEITVTDPNGYIRLESGDAETIMVTVNKLIERCGGYIVFTTAEDGARVINWLEQVGKLSSQIIELGENLFDVSRTGANTDLATAVIPYGAKDSKTGKRLTIEKVNAGKDYIVDEEAVALRGTITKAVVWDDVTTAENLLKKARQYLDERKLVITSLNLTALDLSYVDKSIDSYEVGDLIHVRSKAHLIDDDFQLVEHSEDLLNPANSSIVLGKEIASLTRLDVAGNAENKSEMQQIATEIKGGDYVKSEQLSTTLEEFKTLLKEELDLIYQNKTDETLGTTDKTIVGAINEILKEVKA